MHAEDKEYHSAEECLLDLMKQGLPPEEVIRRFREKGYSLDGETEGESEEKEEVEAPVEAQLPEEKEPTEENSSAS